ncbi:MAG: alanine/ornithine racemase family PLP-dependent enzyme [bacterium]|nr:alanine/ornithine racemase family PLP-dependent enzyme [bacterium]
MTVNPRLVIQRDKLRHNLRYIKVMLSVRHVSLALVTKVFCADRPLVDLVAQEKVDYWADSRTENLRKVAGTGIPRLLLRVAMPSEAERVIECSELSLQSEIATIRCLGEAAQRLDKKHGVVLMIDMGDLREGIFFRNRALIRETAFTVMEYPYLELLGVGVNLTCYGAIIPDGGNLGGLVEIAQWLRSETGLPLPLVSGGNSSSLGLVNAGKAPSGITNLRIGEAFVLGNDTAKCEVMEGLYGDAFTLVAELIEVQRKPSMPIGTSGANAFGEKVCYEDRGEHWRGILALGRQDVIAENLRPLDKNVRVLGASSDHLLVDLGEETAYQVGQELRFAVDYGNLLRAYTSPYIAKEYR